MKCFKVWLVAALALCVAVPVFASPSLYTVQLPRVTYPLGVLTPDTTSGYTVEASGASTIVTTDTLAAFYCGGLNILNGNGAVSALFNAIRVTVSGVPQLVAGDSIYVWADFAPNKNGPWFTQKTSVVASAILLNGLGAGAADTLGVGTWLTYLSYNAGGSNSLFPTPNVFSGWIQVNPSLATIGVGGVPGPLGQAWCRLRLAGDHGASATLYGATTTVTVLTDVAPQVSAGPRQ